MSRTRLRLATGRAGGLSYNFRSFSMRSCSFLLLSFAFIWSSLASNPTAQKAFREGLRYEAAGQWKEAEKAYSAAIQSDAGDASFYRHRAKVRSLTGDQQSALKDCSEAIRLLPTDAESYQVRGDVYRALSDPKRALADYDRAIQLKLDTPAIYNSRAATHAS